MATLIATEELKAPGPGDRALVPVYVWEFPVRFAHWMLVLSLIVLTVTGFYMHRPFFEAHGSRAWVMGTVRFVHELFGFILIAALLLRFYWFFAGNRWAHWRALLPITKRQWTGAASMAKFYAFLRREPIPEIGHNPLAAMAYLAVLLLLVTECLTGLILYSVVSQSRVLTYFLGWIPRLVDIQYIRLAHYLIMFSFMAFLIHHVYSAVLVAIEQRNGLMESIFSGWKFVPQRLLMDDSRIGSRTSSGRLFFRSTLRGRVK
ncbi:MAG TPA: Ni/Fe-hydrogenase, b-type cytochrome subunit [Acidobacteriaceae bacterium]|nr:Ni/Fe-hydrogenase, b-type cytochrome subunit [Acidobacteriaceae bacterium]